jgi:hypothetical protein
MLKSISFKKLAVLSAGIAIVLSSCGLQNEASESSGAGKTKNFALLGDGNFCYDSNEEQQTAIQVNNDAHRQWHLNPTTLEDHQAIFDKMNLILAAQIGGCPAPTPALSAVAEASVLTCVTKEQKQQMIDGYTEQLARPLGGEVTEAYLAIMQKGLDVTKATCTK